MTRVLIFGTFDMIHKGHEYLFEQARKYGDELWVVVARDETVEKLKGRKPKHAQEERKKQLEDHALIDHAVIGQPGDKYKVIEDIKPEVICLGYDQKAFTDKLQDELLQRGIACKILRLQAFKPEIYKTSKLMK